MAQIFAFGRVENDLVPKKSQKDSTYVCFGFTEQTGKGQFQYYQVWAWDDEISRLARLGVKKDSRLWITGTQQLMDCTAGHGKERTKILKIYLSNFGFLPGRISKEGSTNFPDEPGTADTAPPPCGGTGRGTRVPAGVNPAPVPKEEPYWFFRMNLKDR